MQMGWQVGLTHEHVCNTQKQGRRHVRGFNSTLPNSVHLWIHIPLLLHYTKHFPKTKTKTKVYIISLRGIYATLTKF